MVALDELEQRVAEARVRAAQSADAIAQVLRSPSSTRPVTATPLAIDRAAAALSRNPWPGLILAAGAAWLIWEMGHPSMGRRSAAAGSRPSPDPAQLTGFRPSMKRAADSARVFMADDYRRREDKGWVI